MTMSEKKTYLAQKTCARWNVIVKQALSTVDLDEETIKKYIRD